MYILSFIVAIYASTVDFLRVFDHARMVGIIRGRVKIKAPYESLIIDNSKNNL